MPGQNYVKTCSEQHVHSSRGESNLKVHQVTKQTNKDVAYTKECYLATKRTLALTHTATWANLEHEVGTVEKGHMSYGSTSMTCSLAAYNSEWWKKQEETMGRPVPNRSWGWLLSSVTVLKGPPCALKE